MIGLKDYLKKDVTNPNKWSIVLFKRVVIGRYKISIDLGMLV